MTASPSHDGDSDRPAAVVTGAASGIGRALALRLGELGYRLVLVDLEHDGLTDLASAHPSHEAIVADVSDPDAWQGLAETLDHDCRNVSLLVNAAGTLLAGRLVDCDAAAVRRLVEVNLLGTLYGCRAMTPLLVRSQATVPDAPPLPRGVLNVASIFATVAPPGFAAYNASKAGVVALTETLRGELSADGVTATVVLPGVTPTGLFDRADYADTRLRRVVDRYLDSAELTAASVADASLDAYGRGRLRAAIGRKAKRFALLKRLLPTRVINTVAKRASRELDLPGPPCGDESHGVQ